MVGKAWSDPRILRSATFLVAVAAAAVCSAPSKFAHAQGLTYVDADELSGNLTASANIPVSDAIDSNSNPAIGTDNKWGYRGIPLTTPGFGAAETVFESANGAEDSPELKQRISGLTAGASSMNAITTTCLYQRRCLRNLKTNPSS